MSTTTPYNFNPGPTLLPTAVVEEIQTMLGGRLNHGSPSVFEISHRSKDFDHILKETGQLVRRLLGVPDNYHVLFLPGGASQQFCMIPLNLMDSVADYVITGYWSERALKEAKCIGKPNVAFDSKDNGFRRIPRAKEITTHPESSYLHITSNNTIMGTQFAELPVGAKAPLIVDMSSDIFARKIPLEGCAMIYAGAQKNIGVAGVTLVIMEDKLAERSYRELPNFLTYKSHIEKNSTYNTPPVYAIYVMQLVLRWMEQQGGLEKIEATNRKKAALVYELLDASALYQPLAHKDDRSFVSITFNLPTDTLMEQFNQSARERGFIGLKGHRSLGGVRASLYNAVTLEQVETLVDFMQEFEKSHEA